MERTRGIKDKTIIRCENVTKEFSSGGEINKVIGGIDLEVHENEFLVLIGPGQCGKTTLINLIAGLDTPTKGNIYVNDKLVTKPGPDRGVVYQKTALFPWLTVMGNIEYGLKIRGIKRKERRRIAQKYIDLVGLTGFENTYPIRLSGGMGQRVGIARAYANDPVLMLMDEPFSHLDAQTRYMMGEELQRIWQSEKKTVVFVTNNIEEAVYLADRIILLSNCPTKVQNEYHIDMPRPRNYISSKFLEYRTEIMNAMEKTL